jgi:hypothetical protein
VLDSEYQSINIHCIVLNVKFDGGLSISVLRNKQLFKKKRRSKSSHFQVCSSGFLFFQPRHLKKVQKSLTFFGSHFSCEENGQTNFKFVIELEVLFIYRLIPRETDCPGWLTAFATTPVSRFLGASRSFLGRTQRKSTCLWVSVDRYALHRVDFRI